jgi:hypothetical protein
MTGTDTGALRPGLLRRLMRRSHRHQTVDRAVTGLLICVDVLLVGGILLLGSDGIFTEDWLGYPGMMDSTGAGYQRDCVMFLYRLEAVTVGLTVACRLWITAGTQLVLLTSGALFIGSLSTYWNP